jgi:hypothetical protein
MKYARLWCLYEELGSYIKIFALFLYISIFIGGNTKHTLSMISVMLCSENTGDIDDVFYDILSV